MHRATCFKEEIAPQQPVGRAGRFLDELQAVQGIQADQAGDAEQESPGVEVENLQPVWHCINDGIVSPEKQV